MSIRAAIVGCGKMAEVHAAIISYLPHSELIATCDSEVLMARQLAERYGAKNYYDNVDRLLADAKPDVVHITTPPQSHYLIGKMCLESGSHIFVEKPFTVNYQEAKELIDIAKAKGRKLTIGTDEQFSIVATKARDLIKDGWLGGRPVHLDVFYCYDMSDERYTKSFLKNKSHWVWKLPGQMIQNIIPHAVMKIAEYIDDSFDLIAIGFTSNYFLKLGEKLLVDELRVMMIDKNQMTAFLSFSTQMKPAMIQFRILGPQNGIVIDEVQQSIIKLHGRKYKSYLERFVPLYKYSKQYKKNFYKNLGLFIKREFHMKRGLYNLIESFYKSIENDEAPPISYEDILKCSKITDMIIKQIYKETLS